MEIKIDRSELLKAVSRVQSIIERKKQHAGSFNHPF